MTKIIAVVILLFCFFEQASAQDNKQPQPHVLFIAIDDLRPDLGCYGNREVVSPNIDKLASEGMVFSRAYCQQALCGPSRLSVMTGMHPDRLGLWGMSGAHEIEWRETRKGMTSLSEQFRLNGYKAYGYGKIYDHRLGNDVEHSWDEYTAGKSSYNIDKHNREGKSVDGTSPLRPAFLSLDVEDDELPDGDIAQEAITKLKAHDKKQPLFLAVGFQKPHLPFVAPQKYFDLYETEKLTLAERRSPPEWHTEFLFSWYKEINGYDVPYPIPEDMQRKLIEGYYACVSYVDAQIGEIIDALKAKGMYENTMIVIWGDHGFKLGEHGEWAKHTNTEHDTRAPLIIKALGSYQRNATTKSLVEFVDIYPTMCELAGIPTPDNIEGRSLVPVLKNAENTVREFALSQYPMVRTTMSYTIRTDNWRYIETRSDITGEFIAAELYDLSKESIEIKDEYKTHPEVAKKHADLLDEYLKSAKKWTGGEMISSWGPVE
jgi:iduronate 2-sulfatase